MCHYITAVLPATADHVALDALARVHGRRFVPLSNASIEARLEPGERYFSTTPGYCDCGTPLGALARDRDSATDWSAHERRLLARGWTRAKVARAMAQKQERARAALEARAASNAAASLPWVGFIRAVLSSGRTSHLGLLLHWYSGGLDERIELSGRETMAASELTEEALGRLDEDVLHVFRQ